MRETDERHDGRCGPVSRGKAAPRIVRFAEGRRMPWRNGGGETVEVAVQPPEAAPERVGWRVSLATIACDGPFSTFGGIDRTFMLLDGGGVDLAIGAGPPMRLDVDGGPLRFAGEAPCRCALSGRPAIALNVMTERGSFESSVTRLGRDRVLPRVPGAVTLLVGADGGCGTDLGRLGPLDVLIVPPGAEVGIRPGESSARMAVVSIWPAARRRPARDR